MAARFSGGGALGTLIRESQDLSARWRDRNNALIEAVSKPEGQRNPAAIDTVRREMADIETKLAANAARLEQGIPRLCGARQSEAVEGRGRADAAWRRRGAGVLLPGDRRATFLR